MASAKLENPGGSFSPRISDPVRAARLYRRMGNHWLRYSLASELSRGKSVLDFGCGFGVGTSIVATQARYCLGVDVDIAAIEWATRSITPRFPNCSFGGQEELSAAGRTGSFDVVLSFEVVEHVSDPRSHFEILKRYVSDDGLILLSTPNGLLSGHDRRLFRTPFHVDEYTIDELLSAISPVKDDIEFLKERRRDRLDVLTLRANRLRINQVFTSSRPGPGPGILDRVAGKAFEVVWNHFNGPIFWQLCPATLDDLRAPDYSTIVLVWHPQHGGSGRCADSFIYGHPRQIRPAKGLDPPK